MQSKASSAHPAILSRVTFPGRDPTFDLSATMLRDSMHPVRLVRKKSSAHQLPRKLGGKALWSALMSFDEEAVVFAICSGIQGDTRLANKSV